MLETLMAAQGATVSAEELLERVWDEHTDPFTNVVRMTIMTLRRKLGEPQVVETVIGVGYRIGLMARCGSRRARRRAPARIDGPAPTIRLRLTVLYGLVFLVTGAVLLTIGYALVRHNLGDAREPSRRPAEARARRRRRARRSSGGSASRLARRRRASPTPCGRSCAATRCIGSCSSTCWRSG